MKPDVTIGEVIGRKEATVWSVEPELSVYEAVEILSTHEHRRSSGHLRGSAPGDVLQNDYTCKIVLEGKSSR